MIDERKLVMPTAIPETLKQVGGNGATSAAAPDKGGNEAYQSLSRLGGRAWQLLAALRGADHFIAQDADADRSAGSWLVACAVDLADEVAGELDALSRTLKERPAESGAVAGLHKLRARAHKLHAATRAADHFLDQDTGEDRSTASWLVACALDLAARLAAEIDDQAGQLKRAGSSANTVPAFSDVVSGRKSPAATLRGAIG